MNITPPIDRTDLDEKKRRRYTHFQKLISALEEKELTEDFVQLINGDIELLNKTASDDPSFTRLLRKTQTGITSKAQKMLKYVTKNYYLALWMSVGMATFGIPFGFMFSTALDNFGFLGLGLPFGMSIGIAIGAGLDKKAESEGRQLDFKASI